MDLGGEEDGGSNVARELHRRRQMLMQQTNLLGLGDGCHLAFQLGGDVDRMHPAACHRFP